MRIFEDTDILYDDVCFDDLHYALSVYYAMCDYCGVDITELPVEADQLKRFVWACGTIHSEPFARNVHMRKKRYRLMPVKEEPMDFREAYDNVLGASQKIANEFIEKENISIGQVMAKRMNDGTIFG